MAYGLLLVALRKGNARKRLPGVWFFFCTRKEFDVPLEKRPHRKRKEIPRLWRLSSFVSSVISITIFATSTAGR